MGYRLLYWENQSCRREQRLLGLADHLWRMVIAKVKTGGVMWNVGADGAEVSEVMAACGGGLQAVLGDHVGFVLSGSSALSYLIF